MNNFDKTVTDSIELAQAEALKRKNNELTEYHLLWGLITNPSTIISRHLKGEKKVIQGLLEKLPTIASLSIN